MEVVLRLSVNILLIFKTFYFLYWLLLWCKIYSFL